VVRLGLTLEGVAFGVGELAGEDLDEVDQLPNAAATEGQELDDPGDHVAGVEAVRPTNAQAGQEGAEQQGNHLFLRFGGHVGFLLNR